MSASPSSITSGVIELAEIVAVLNPWPGIKSGNSVPSNPECPNARRNESKRAWITNTGKEGGRKELTRQEERKQHITPVEEIDVEPEDEEEVAE